MRFKSTAGIEPGALDAARAAAVAVARLVAAATVPQWTGTLPNAAAMRRAILDEGRPWVGFEDLVAACWQHGVPVVYLPELPVGGRKMDGLVTEVDGRPVIVIAKKLAGHPAWGSFILGHEMGHIALGHLETAGDDTIVDGDLDTLSEDPVEVVANAFAVELLTGAQDRRYRSAYPARADRLAKEARATGQRDRVDPGHVVLNWTREMVRRDRQNYWPLANKALAAIGTASSVATLCRSALEANLDLDRLPDDSVDFLAASGVIADA